MPLPTKTKAAGARTLLRDRAYEMIFDSIQTGTLVPGEILRDDDLIDWLGMSRTPIRNALIRLSDVGLIEMSAGRSTRVAELAQDRTNRALLVSACFNEYALRRVVADSDDTVIAACHDARGAVQDAAAEGGVALARAVSAFFDTLTDSCGNDVLDAQVDRIDHELARFLQPGPSVVDTASLAAGIENVDDALQGRDVTRCVSALRELYSLSRSNFLARFREPEIE